MLKLAVLCLLLALAVAAPGKANKKQPGGSTGEQSGGSTGEVNAGGLTGEVNAGGSTGEVNAGGLTGDVSAGGSTEEENESSDSSEPGSSSKKTEESMSCESGSCESGSNESGFDEDEFYEEFDHDIGTPYNVSAFQGHFVQLKDQIGEIIQHVNDIKTSDSEQMESLFDEIGETFWVEEIRLLHILLSFWISPGDFSEERKCQSTIHLAEQVYASVTDPDSMMNGQELSDLRQESLAFDFNCFRMILNDLKQSINTDTMIPPYSEEDAFKVITDVGLQMFKIKHNGMAFWEAHTYLSSVADNMHVANTKRINELETVLKRMLGNLERQKKTDMFDLDEYKK